jgi:hypothetical protein
MTGTVKAESLNVLAVKCLHVTRETGTVDGS